jgi:hypothetical protein
MTAKKVVARAALRATLALFSSFAFWFWGFFDDRILDFSDQDLWCWTTDHPDRQVISVDQKFFLPSAVCHYADGGSRQLVPWFIVPSMFLCLAVAVFIVFHAIHTLNKHELWV